MLQENMYVRCPADRDSITDPRIFVCGQIVSIDDFKQTVTVRIHDPFQFLVFFEELPKGTIELPMNMVEHCSMFIGSEIMAKGNVCKVLSERTGKDGYFYYYVQVLKDKSILRISEKNIIASFTNGRVDPANQLKRYEFQNPCWYMGHTVVSRSMNVLENSIYGFKELAGSKIYLLPHQINTIMRCLQESPCRYMLADEVGMGKTIEAVSVLKIFMQNKANTSVLIIVPETLKEQWKTELLLKFNISIGKGKDNNNVIIKTPSELALADGLIKWDFVIIDEVHKYLGIERDYKMLHAVSRVARNILVLSATPVQQRKEEYLDLLRLLQPEKYDKYDIERFSELVNKQSKIIQKTALILDDLGDYEEEIDAALSEEENPHDSEDCKELYDEIHDDIEEICDELNDEKLSTLFNKIEFNDDDLGVYKIKIILSYICSSYQVESHIIRNRRKILENTEDGSCLLPTRELQSATYTLDKDKNTYEAICYQLISDWLADGSEQIDIEGVIRPLLGSFFSSPWAFNALLEELKQKGTVISTELFSNAKNWLSEERHLLENITDVLDDPDTYEDEYNTRMVSILNYLYDELYDKKIVIFTNYKETFIAYKTAFEKVFPAEEISFFGWGMSAEEIELNAYRFQNEDSCRMILCDYSGGEGRNFQCADYIVHIDLPWDANIIEQRIGRLDRLERDPERPIVNSVVIYSEDTFEEALFNFWCKGLKIFTQSLSGMEIIMKDINEEIVSAVKEDFKYGLFERVPKIIEIADYMREIVRKEQNYDAAGFMFRPMYAELKRLIDYYAQNENALFASTMTNWASLAGFRGIGSKSGVITYTAYSFVPKSAIKSQLIPPKWNDYLDTEQNRFVNGVQNAYDKKMAIKAQDRSIRGTFIRKQAIENDYLHFFAPGDEVFDCIVNNAINSCKGRASAFAVPADINWRGLVFIWSLSPNENYLMDNGVSIYALSPYRNYLMSEQVVIPISIDNIESYSDERIVREFNQIINAGYNKSGTVHLGKRERSAGFLKEIISGDNIEWFKNEFSEEIWEELVDNARQEAYKKAFEQFKRRSNIRGAREEMERSLSAKVANSLYYGVDDDTIETIKQEQDILLDAMKRPKVTLDSAALVWMVNRDDG